MSGEIADRPGINLVWAGIEAKRWDLIIAEESSRLYRHHTKAGELVESAVDAGGRWTAPPGGHSGGRATGWRARNDASPPGVMTPSAVYWYTMIEKRSSPFSGTQP